VRRKPGVPPARPPPRAVRVWRRFCAPRTSKAASLPPRWLVAGCRTRQTQRSTSQPRTVPLSGKAASLPSPPGRVYPPLENFPASTRAERRGLRRRNREDFHPPPAVRLHSGRCPNAGSIRNGKHIHRQPTEAEREAYQQKLKVEREGMEANRELGRERRDRRKETDAARSALDALQKPREQENVSLRELEERTGIAHGNLSRLWNNPEPNLTIDTLERIAKALGRRLRIELEEPS